MVNVGSTSSPCKELANVLALARLDDIYPSRPVAFDPFQSLSANSNVSLAARDDVAPGIELRILPLGSSITYGTQSVDGNGYRLNLLKHLSGTKVEYIGSVRNGEMADNYNEGHPGYRVE